MPTRASVHSQNLKKVLSRLALAIAAIAIGTAFGGDGTDDARTPRQIYNEGTLKLRQGKLREAESSLQIAVASQNEAIQTAALYNLGEVRFLDGMRELTNAPEGKTVNAMTDRAGQTGDTAMGEIDGALLSDDVRTMVSAYMRGRGARKELKGAIDAVKRAMESYNVVLTRWQRSAGDFRSTYELRPGDVDARTNADAVDRWIAKLVDQMKPMMPSQPKMEGQRSELQKKMQQLMKKMPAEVQEQLKNSGGTEEDDENGEQKERKEPKAGQEEGPNKSGREIQLTPEEASRLLGMLKLDSNRKLSYGGMEETAKPQAHKGKDW